MYHVYVSDYRSSTIGTYQKQWDETWFISDPEVFVIRHLPMTIDNHVDKEKQYIKRPYEDVSTWDNDLYYNAIAVAAQIEPLSHADGVIEAIDGTVKLELTSPIPGRAAFYYSFLQTLNSQDITQHGLLYFYRGKLVCDIRLPKAGEYVLKIMLADEAMDEELDQSVMNLCYMFKIRGTGSMSHDPYPRESRWGPFPEMLASGCSILGYKGPVLKTKSGLIQVAIQLPVSAICPILMQLHDQFGNKQSNKCLYMERQGQRITVHVACPNKGQFVLAAHAKFQEGDTYSGIAKWLIVCDSPAANKDMFPEYSSVYAYGPLPGIIPLALQIISPLTSTITAKDGSATLTLKCERPLTIISKLLTSSGELYYKYLASINEETEDDKINIHLRIAEAGIYKLDLYAGEINKNTFPEVAHFLVKVEKDWTGPQFIEHKGLWGITSPNITLLKPRCSTVVAKNGETTIELQCKTDMEILHKLIDSNGTEYENASAAVYASWHDDNIISYNLRIPHAGMYKLEIFGGSKGHSSLQIVGNLLIQVDKGWKGDLFPDNTSMWGLSSFGNNMGVKVLHATGGLFTMSKPGTLSFQVECPSGIAVMLDLVSEDDEEDRFFPRVEDDIQETKVAIYDKGLYKIKLWGREHHAKQYNLFGTYLVVCGVKL